MPAALNVSSTTVAAGETTFDLASVHVRGTRARVVVRRETVLDRDDAVSVTKPSRKEWLVRFADGAEWAVRKVGCGCGS